MKDRLHGILTRSWQVAWVLTLIALPVTSFPLLSRLAGGTLVAPLALIPLAWLVITLLPVLFIKRTPIPAESVPLIIFVLAALVSSAFAYFQDIPSYKGYNLSGNSLDGFVTLGIGMAFYFTTLACTDSQAGLRRAFLFINIGGIVLLAWSLLQLVVSWVSARQFPEWMAAVQSVISLTEIQTIPSHFRLSGTTLEPSWLAHCLNILYLPLWLAASSARTSTFRLRLFRLSVENFLLALGVVVLVFTYSRIGLLAFSLMLVWFVLLLSRALARRLAGRVRSNRATLRKVLQNALSLLFLLILLVAIGSLAYRLSQNDPRFAEFFKLIRTQTTPINNLFILANKLDMAERLVYWDLGWKVFEDHPLLGVGLGNTGMFTLRELNFYAWKLPELLRVITIETSLPNAKSLWIRLLAETGLVGGAVFITWLVVLWFAAGNLTGEKDPLLHALGLAGQFCLVALVLEGFSLDTFALPYLWVTLGLLTSASALRRRGLPEAADSATGNTGSHPPGH